MLLQLSARRGLRWIGLCRALVFTAAIMAWPFDGYPQEARVNQRKISREREKKHKQDLKEYDKAVKRHHKMQSKSARASMKQTKKASADKTPIHR